MSHSRFLPLLAALITSSTVGFAETFVLTKIVDQNDPIPGGAGRLFSLPTGSAAIPGLNGNFISFHNLDPNNLTSLWSVSPTGTNLQQLVGSNTVIPGNGGFFNTTNPHVIEKGRVIFNGRGPDVNPDGLYSVPAVGGPVTRLVDRATPVPGGTGNFFFDFNNGSYFSADGDFVAFTSNNGPLDGAQ